MKWLLQDAGGRWAISFTLFKFGPVSLNENGTEAINCGGEGIGGINHRLYRAQFWRSAHNGCTLRRRPCGN